MGVLAAPYNTIEGDVVAYNTVCVRVAAEYCSVQGMVPSIVVLTCEPCFAFLCMPSGSYRMGILGRMAPVGSECAGRRRAMSRVPTSPGRRDVGSESEVGLRAGLLIGEAVRRRLKPELSAPVGEVGQSS